MRRFFPSASSISSSTSASAFVGQASTQRGPSGDFAHRSHTTTLVYAPVYFWRSSPAERADDARLYGAAFTCAVEGAEG